MFNPLQITKALVPCLGLLLLSLSLNSCEKPDAAAEAQPEAPVETPTFAQKTEVDTVITFDSETFEESVQYVENTYYTEVETFPVFGDCSQSANDKESIESCSFTNLMMAVYNNIKYPEAAHAAGIDGTVHVSFRLSPNGDMFYSFVESGSKEKLTQGLELSPEQEAAYAALDKAALEATRALDGNWTPAMVDGEAVTIQLTLPIKFKIEG